MNKLTAILIAASALVPAIAISGQHSVQEVSIAPTPYVAGRTRAQGTLMGARNSADVIQYIGCRAHQEIGYCYARDAAGRTFMCSSSDPKMLTAMVAVGASSHLIIDAATGTCKNLEVTNMSRYLAPIGSGLITNAPSSL